MMRMIPTNRMAWMELYPLELATLRVFVTAHAVYTYTPADFVRKLNFFQKLEIWPDFWISLPLSDFDSHLHLGRAMLREGRGVVSLCRVVLRY